MTTLTEIRCVICGILFGMDPGLAELRLADGKPFCCPNGHTQGYTVRRNLEEELAQVKKELSETQEKLVEAQIEIRRLKCEELAKKL